MVATVDGKPAKLFYDPHPGFGGAVVPLPATVLQAARELNGQVMPVPQAIGLLQRAFPSGAFRADEQPDESSAGSIILKVGREGGVQHVWRVIRYRTP